MNRTRTFALAAVALLFSVSAGTAAGQDDPLPPLPPLPKPDAKAEFKLIVEGDGGGGQTVKGSGSNGVCNIYTDTQSSQRYEYGRGKGLEVVFTKYKFPGQPPLVLLKRKGQRQGAVFTVKGSYESEASGTATRSGENPGICVPTTETVGDEEECGRHSPERTDLSLNTTFNGELVLDVAARQAHIPGTGCGANGVETLSGDPRYGWPNFPELKPEEIPDGKIFGKKAKRKFKVSFTSGWVKTDEEGVAGSIVIRVSNTASHDAVARFIRTK